MYSHPSSYVPRPWHIIFLTLLTAAFLSACESNPQTDPHTTPTPNTCTQDDQCPSNQCVNNTCVPLARCQTNNDCTEEGRFCYVGLCRPKEEICGYLGCGTAESRGVCIAEQGRCIPPTGSCESNDFNCNVGDYCAADNTCKRNHCLDGTVCDRGVCNKDNGCVNKDICQKSTDCIPGDVCVKTSDTAKGGTCEPATQECNKLNCLPEQRCVYDPNTFVATCKQPSNCASSTVCNDGNVCHKGECVAATTVTCTPDAFDTAPNNNNTPDKAASYNPYASSSSVKNLTLCGDDVDWFSFDPSQRATSGELAVTLVIEGEDVGVKPVSLALYEADGTTQIGETQTSLDTNNNYLKTLTIRHTLPSPLPTDYKIKVSTEKTSAPPLRYQLFADVLPTTASATSCQAVETKQALEIGKLTQGRIDAVGLTDTCSDSQGIYSKDAWKFTLTERSHVEVALTPGLDSDLAFSLRTACQLMDSTVDNLCVNKHGNNYVESGRYTLNPGDYYLIVSSATSYGDPNYSVKVDATPTVCTPEENRCVGGVAVTCNSTQTGWDRQVCELGCHETYPLCKESFGDRCETAIPVSYNNPVVRNFDVKQFRNNYEPGNTCFNIGSAYGSDAFFKGNEVVFAVEVGPGEILDAKTTNKITVSHPNNDTSTSIYVTKDCSTLATDSCLATAQGSVPNLPHVVWKNPSSTETETLYVIVDYSTLQTTSTIPPSYLGVDIQVKKPLCDTSSVPVCIGETKIQRCHSSQLKYEYEACSEGCTKSSSATGDSCKVTPTSTPAPTKDGDGCNKAIEWTAPFDGSEELTPLNRTTYSQYTNVDEPPACATNYVYPQNVREIYYKLELEQGKLYKIKATASGSSSSPRIWLSDTCDTNSGKVGQCLGGGYGSSATINYTATKDETIYLVAEFYSRFYIGNELKISVEKIDIGTPYEIGTCNNSNELQYNNSLGEPKTYTCDTCQSGTDLCVSSTPGETCYDAERLYDGGTTKEGNKADTIGSTNQADGLHLKNEVDQCRFFSNNTYPKGKDKYYRFDLKAGERLDIDFKDEGENVAAYFQSWTKCGSNSSCFGTRGVIGSQKLSHYAETDEKIFLVTKVATTTPQTEDYSFDWKVTPTTADGKCALESYSCNSNDLVYCDSEGKTKTYKCKSSCQNGACLPNDNLGKTCQDDDVITVNDDTNVDLQTTFFINPNDYTIEENTRTGNISCIETKGNDYFFKVYLDKDKVLRANARAAGAHLLGLALSTTCDTFSESCQQGSLETRAFNLPARIEYQAPQAGWYYLAAAYQEKSHSQPFYVDIQVTDPTCSDSDPIIKCTDETNGTLEYCESGQTKTLTCTGGCSNTTNTCTTPSGDLCIDPIVLSGTSGTVGLKDLPRGKRDNHLLYKSGLSGACYLSTQLSGDEHYYAIELEPNDELTLSEIEKNAAHERDQNVVLYITDGCFNNEQCLASNNSIGDRSRPRELKFRATHTSGKKRYYIVVATKQLAPKDAQYTFKYKVKSASTTCVPYQSYCKDEHTLVQCTSDSTSVEVSCDCLAGVCHTTQAAIDECYDSLLPTITKGGVYQVPLNHMSNNITLDVASCIGTRTFGQDAFFRVKIPAKTTFKASVKGSLKTDFHKQDMVMYVAKSCIALRAGECIKGNTYISSKQREIINKVFEYRNDDDTEQTLTFGMDVIHSTPPGTPDPLSQLLYVEFEGRQCETTTPIACDSQKTALLYCNPQTYRLESYTCASPTMGDACADAKCTAPSGAICLDAIEANADGSPIQGTLTGAGNNYSFTDAQIDTETCGTFFKAEGPDRFYRVKVAAGKTLKASLKSTAATAQNLSLYITKTCNGEQTMCLAGADETKDNKATAETVEYTAGSSEEVVFVVVDGREASASGEYELTLSIKH